MNTKSPNTWEWLNMFNLNEVKLWKINERLFIPYIWLTDKPFKNKKEKGKYNNTEIKKAEILYIYWKYIIDTILSKLEVFDFQYADIHEYIDDNFLISSAISNCKNNEFNIFIFKDSIINYIQKYLKEHNIDSENNIECLDWLRDINIDLNNIFSESEKPSETQSKKTSKEIAEII